VYVLPALLQIWYHPCPCQTRQGDPSMSPVDCSPSFHSAFLQTPPHISGCYFLSETIKRHGLPSIGISIKYLAWCRFILSIILSFLYKLIRIHCYVLTRPHRLVTDKDLDFGTHSWKLCIVACYIDSFFLVTLWRVNGG